MPHLYEVLFEFSIHECLLTYVLCIMQVVYMWEDFIVNHFAFVRCTTSFNWITWIWIGYNSYFTTVWRKKAFWVKWIWWPPHFAWNHHSDGNSKWLFLVSPHYKVFWNHMLLLSVFSSTLLHLVLYQPEGIIIIFWCFVIVNYIFTELQTNLWMKILVV